MDHLLLRGALVAGQQDVALRQGRSRQMAPEIHTAALDTLDLTSKLVLRWERAGAASAAQRSHLHPDTAQAFVADWAPGLRAGGPSPQALMAELKILEPEPRARVIDKLGAARLHTIKTFRGTACFSGQRDRESQSKDLMP